MSRVSRTSPPRGFSLIELAVAFVLLGIISAIAYMSFQALRSGTIDSTHQNELRQLSASFQLYQQDHNAFPDRTRAASMEPQNTYIAIASTSPTRVSYGTGTSGPTTYLGLAILSDTGSCLTIAVAPSKLSQPTFTGKFDPVPGSPCTYDTAISRGSHDW